jgi:hypothetical protein
MKVKRLIVSNTDELGGGRYERVGSEKALVRVRSSYRIQTSTNER